MEMDGWMQAVDDVTTRKPKQEAKERDEARDDVEMTYEVVSR